MYVHTYCIQVQPLVIEYSRIAKKIDVKKVKSKIWSIITKSQENDQVCTYVCRYIRTYVRIMDMIYVVYMYFCYFSNRMYSTVHTYTRHAYTQAMVQHTLV